MQAFLSPATNMLFGGASEGGKSAFERLATSIWCTVIPNLQVYFFRKYYGDVLTHMEGPTGFRTLLRNYKAAGIVRLTENEIRWPATGSLISLNQIRTREDLEKHRGREKNVLVIDESTQIPEAYINELEAWCRMPKEMKDLLPELLKDLYPHIPYEERRELFPRVIKAANPEGESFTYHKRTYILPRKPFVIEKKGAWKYQYIPSKVLDNPSADPDAQRERLLPLGEARARALIEGDWTAPSGDYFDNYVDDIHSVDDFVPPAAWFRFRTFDWGSAEPFAVYWWCVSDGETFRDHQGNSRWFPYGALIAYREYYGCNPEQPAKGLKMRNEDIAQEIVNRTVDLSPQGIWVTLSDSFPFADRGDSRNKRQYTMADTFKDNGCPLVRGNTRRIFGYKQMRSRLDGVAGIPMLYITKSCIYLREYIPALPKHDTNPEDAAESGEATHSTDACRIACASKPIVLSEPKTVAPTFKTDNTSISPKQLLERMKRRHGRRKR